MKKSKLFDTQGLRGALSRRGRKAISASTTPRLLTISDDDRQKLLSSRVLNILEERTADFNMYLTQGKRSFEGIPKRLNQYREKDCPLWRKASTLYENEMDEPREIQLPPMNIQDSPRPSKKQKLSPYFDEEKEIEVLKELSPVVQQVDDRKNKMDYKELDKNNCEECSKRRVEESLRSVREIGIQTDDVTIVMAREIENKGIQTEPHVPMETQTDKVDKDVFMESDKNGHKEVIDLRTPKLTYVPFDRSFECEDVDLYTNSPPPPVPAISSSSGQRCNVPFDRSFEFEDIDLNTNSPPPSIHPSPILPSTRRSAMSSKGPVNCPTPPAISSTPENMYNIPHHRSFEFEDVDLYTTPPAVSSSPVHPSTRRPAMSSKGPIKCSTPIIPVISSPVNRRTRLPTASSKCPVPCQTPPATSTPIQYSNHTPMLNYSLIDTPILKQELKRYGLKVLPRTKAKVLLRHIYKETHK